MAVKEYNPKEVTLTVAGNIITGFADGSFVSIERNEDSWTLQVGTDGEGTRSKSNNKSGRVTFQLMQSSASNDILSGLFVLDEATSGGAVPVMVKYKNSVFIAETAWITRPASVEYGREAGPREWVLETDVLSMKHAGQ